MTDPLSAEGTNPGQAPNAGDPLSGSPGAKTYSSFDEALNDLKVDDAQKQSLKSLEASGRSKAVTEAQKEWAKKSLPAEEVERRSEEKANSIVEAKLKERDLISERQRILREQFGVTTHKDGQITEDFRKVGATLKAAATKAGLDYELMTSTASGFRSLCVIAGLKMAAQIAAEDDVIDTGGRVLAPMSVPLQGKKVSDMTPTERFFAEANGLVAASGER